MKTTKILEEIINEVSAGLWARAAASSLPKRKEEAEKKHQWKEYYNKNVGKNLTDYIKPEREKTKKGAPRKKFTEGDYDTEAFKNSLRNYSKLDRDARKADLRARHAELVKDLGIPKGASTKANKLTQAARNVFDSRKWERAGRWSRAYDITYVDPNRKKRNDEDLAAKRKAEDEAQERRIKAKEDRVKRLEKYGNVKDFTNFDEYTMKADKLEKGLKDKKGIEKAGSEHQNARIDQALRDKLERSYNKNIKESIMENFEISESTKEEILSLVESYLDEAIKDEVKTKFRTTDGSHVFSYRGNDYEYRNGNLRKTGKTKEPGKNVLEIARDELNDNFTRVDDASNKISRVYRHLLKNYNKKAKNGGVTTKDTEAIEGAQAAKRWAEDNAEKVNNVQKKLAKTEKGIKYREVEPHQTKKGDNFGFHKSGVKISEEVMASIFEVSDKLIDDAKKERENKLVDQLSKAHKDGEDAKKKGDKDAEERANKEYGKVYDQYLTKRKLYHKKGRNLNIGI